MLIPYFIFLLYFSSYHVTNISHLSRHTLSIYTYIFVIKKTSLSQFLSLSNCQQGVWVSINNFSIYIMSGVPCPCPTPWVLLIFVYIGRVPLATLLMIYNSLLLKKVWKSCDF